MLGLGSNIIKSGKSYELIGTYTSDFTSGVDSWEPWGEQGTLTLASNQNPSDLSGSYPDSAGWLQGDFDTNQTDMSGIKVLNITTGWTRATTDRFDVAYTIILASTIAGVANDWGTDDVTTDFRVGNETGIGEAISTGGDEEVEIPVHQVFSFTSGISAPIGISNYNDLGLAWIALDRPLATARFYIKDIVVNFYR